MESLGPTGPWGPAAFRRLLAGTGSQFLGGDVGGVSEDVGFSLGPRHSAAAGQWDLRLWGSGGAGHTVDTIEQDVCPGLVAGSQGRCGRSSLCQAQGPSLEPGEPTLEDEGRVPRQARGRGQKAGRQGRIWLSFGSRLRLTRGGTAGPISSRARPSGSVDGQRSARFLKNKTKSSPVRDILKESRYLRERAFFLPVLDRGKTSAWDPEASSHPRGQEPGAESGGRGGTKLETLVSWSQC